MKDLTRRIMGILLEGERLGWPIDRTAKEVKNLCLSRLVAKCAVDLEDFRKASRSLDTSGIVRLHEIFKGAVGILEARLVRWVEREREVVDCGPDCDV